MYRLIQPASAEDQNKYEFEVDGQKETYTNLGKLKNPPVVKLEGNQPEVEWDGKTFNYQVDMSFAIGEGEFKDESGNIIKNYYMTYGQDISIPDAVCDGCICCAEVSVAGNEIEPYFREGISCGC